MSPEVIEALNAAPKIHVTEAYTGRNICYRTGCAGMDFNRIAEVRFRADEMPEVYYETDNALKMVKENSPDLQCNKNDRACQKFGLLTRAKISGMLNAVLDEVSVDLSPHSFDPRDSRLTDELCTQFANQSKSFKDVELERYSINFVNYHLGVFRNKDGKTETTTTQENE